MKQVNFRDTIPTFMFNLSNHDNEVSQNKTT